MRRAAKVDANQSAVVKALRQLGYSVESLAAVGNGVPDLLVGRNGRTFLLEVKDGSKPPSARALTEHQVQWHQRWKGTPVVVVTGVNEAIAALAGVDTKQGGR